MTRPIGVQLYSVRDALQADFEGSLRRLADMGYAAVEFAGVYGGSPQSAAALCADLGLQITSAHLPLPLDGNEQQVYDTAAALGVQDIVLGSLPANLFTTEAGLRSGCERLNAASENARAHGLRLSYHNHEFEFVSQPDVGVPHEAMRAFLSPDVLFELDVYWALVGGADPAAVLYELGERAALVHLKDGPGVRGRPMQALGSGVMDIPASVAAAANADWLIVELDETEGDMFEALATSLNYLVEQGLANGR